MMRFAQVMVMAATGLCILTTAAFAADPPVTEMTLEQAHELAVGLSALDGHPQIVKDGAHEQVVTEPYKFTAGVLVAIAKDQAALGLALKPYEEVRQKLFREYAVTDEKLCAPARPPCIPPGSNAETQFIEQYRPVLDEKIKISLIHVATSAFKMDEQQFSPAVIRELLPILDDDGK